MVAEAGLEPADDTSFEEACFANLLLCHYARLGQPRAAHQLLRCRFVALALSVATSEILMEEAGFERCKPKAPS